MKKKGNILIIDDNEAMLVSLRMLLKNVCEDVQTSTKPTGSCIGLSISRQIMKQSGGSIELISSDASATLFRLKF